MFCKKCGRKLNDGARFCPGCGTQIIVKQSSQAVSSAGHVCLACCAPLRKGAAFCMKCGAPAIAGTAAPTVTISIPLEAASEDITVSVSDTPPVSAPPRREKRAKKLLVQQAEQRPVQTAKQAAKKAADVAIKQILDLEVPAAETAGEMRIPMSAEQKSCLTTVIKMLGRVGR